ncbi:MAG: exodeoxyribonuclease V subunit alpha [Paucibacter sp.]|nr:exodeoxyribonuclease V subunit alpha [Roseateles sp.]
MDPITPAALQQELKTWVQKQWLRRLDAALAGFMHELDPQADAAVLLAVALLSHLEGRGHACLPLAQLCEDAPDLLGWGAEPAQRLAELNLPTTPAELTQRLAASPLVWQPGAPDSHSPLVLQGQRLYLRRYWQYEQRVASQVLARVSATERLDTAALRGWLGRLFPTPAAGLDWQQLACAVALRSRLAVITGGPGTGKTYTAARLLALLFAVHPQRQTLRVALAAPTGKAAARLKQSIESALQGLAEALAPDFDLRELASHIGPARTLHALLGARPETRAFRADAAHPLELDVLIVDEASMVHLEMMASLLEALPPGARLILLGDKDQLASVEAGAVLGDLCREAERGGYSAATAAFAQAATAQVLPAEYLQAEQPQALAQATVMLRESRRFGGPIGQLALAVNRGDVAAAQALLASAEDQALLQLPAPEPDHVLRLALQGRPGAPGGYASYLQVLRQRPPAEAGLQAFEDWARRVLGEFERFRLLCAVRAGAWGTEGINLAVERALTEAGLLSRRGEWYEGRPIMVTRNDPSVGVFNGDIGIALKPHKLLDAQGLIPLRAYFLDGPQLRSVGVSRLNDVETAFAMTVHKSQGSEFEHTVLVLPEQGGSHLSRELVYTGITRARKFFTLVSPQAQTFHQALRQRTRRASGLLDLLAV